MLSRAGPRDLTWRFGTDNGLWGNDVLVLGLLNLVGGRLGYHAVVTAS